jgi:NAD(P)H-dependent FMN reductase
VGPLLLVSGSLRAQSTSSAILKTAAEMASPQIGCHLYEGLAGLPAFDPDLADDPPEAVRDLYDAVHRAPALLFSVPEYAGALPGAFKNLLDWLIPDDAPGSIYAKAVAWLNVSPRGAPGAHAELRTVLEYAHARIVSEACCSIPVTSGHVDVDGTVGDPLIRARAGEVLRILLAATGQDAAVR